MKRAVIIFFLLAILYGCSDKQTSQDLFNAADLAGVTVAMRNFEGGKSMNEFIATGDNARLTFIPDGNSWTLGKYLFIDCEVANLSDHVQLVEMVIDGDRWSMGGVYFDPGDRKIVRTIIMRQNPSLKQLSQFPNMNGHPGGSIRLWWKSYTPDSINNIALYLPLSEKGDIIRVGNMSASESFTVYSDNEYRALMPIVDEFGQFIHKDWPGKIKTTNDLLSADTRETSDLEANPGYTAMSKYGGWKNGPQLNATGHFRVEKYNGIWAIVDPEGYLFWSHGIDCVRPTSDTPVEGREQFYRFLPDSTGEFNDFVHPGRVSSSYTPDSIGRINLDAVKFVNFYGMNLKRKWGEDYNEKFINRTIQRLKSWEMNTIANWSDRSVFEKREIPYTINVNTARSRMLIDPFDPDFQRLIENQLTSLYPESLDDPWCLGIFIDNEISWGNLSSLGNSVIATDRYPFAKEVMINTLRMKYGSISFLNRVWGSDFGSWEELNVNRERFRGSARDLRNMSGKFADEYFRKCKAAIISVAPNTMYLGCRFDFHFYPEYDSNNSDWVISYGGKYADVVSFNRYNYSCNTMKPLENMDFPIIIGEFHLGALDRGLPHSGLRQSTNQEERAFVYKNFLMQAVRNPYIVGVGWFQYLDQPYTGRSDGENYQIGFITVGDYPNQEIVESARQVGQNMYTERYGNK